MQPPSERRADGIKEYQALGRRNVNRTFDGNGSQSAQF